MALIESHSAPKNGAARNWGRTLLIGLIGAAALALLAVTAIAVALIGLTIAGVALAVRLLRPRTRNADGPLTLEARRMPDGWAAEPNGSTN